MVTTLFSAALTGISGEVVEIEADTSNSLPSIQIVGLPDTIVQESKERIRSAIKNASLPFPRKKVTINLAPADVKKEGTHYDLPIALAILTTALSEKTIALTGKDLIAGELGLSGELRSIKGVLSIALLAKERGFSRLFIPLANVAEASLVEGLTIIGVKSLSGLCDYLAGRAHEHVVVSESAGITETLLLKAASIEGEGDFAHIQGQEHSKRALEIAAAGNHNVFMQGSPGAGKTLLAKALATILPPLTRKEIIEVTRLYSSVGEPLGPHGVKVTRPFRQPHHSASIPALVGGGNSVRPGEITMAHRGILFLDELGEFHRSVLESLRGPLEDGVITVSRAKGTVTYPAKSLLVVAQNPCPCGYYGDPKKECTCTIGEVQRYHRKISGPLLDRIDIHLAVPPVALTKLSQTFEAEPSCDVRTRVVAARKRQQDRFSHIGCLANTELSVADIKKYITLSQKAQTLLQKASDAMGLSARGYFRVLRVAQTIADLEGVNGIAEHHIAEALQYRQKVSG